MVMLRIKLKGMTRAAIWQLIFLPADHSNNTSTFSENGNVSYQIKWNRECSNMHTQPYTHTLIPWGKVKCRNIFFSESSHVA